MTNPTPIINPVALGITTATGTAVPTSIQVVANTTPGIAPTVEAHEQVEAVMATADPLRNPLPGMPIDFPADEVKTVAFPKESHPILKHFEFGHLPLHLQPVSQEFHRLAHLMHDMLPVNAETSAGLRKLLEAKDCMVRSANEGVAP